MSEPFNTPPWDRELLLRLTVRELAELYDALEFEGYGTSREDLRQLLVLRAEEAEGRRE